MAVEEEMFGWEPTSSSSRFFFSSLSFSKLNQSFLLLIQTFAVKKLLARAYVGQKFNEP